MPPRPTPDSYPGTPGTPIYAGRPSPGGSLLTALVLEPDATRTGQPVTFGQPFRAGDVDPTTHDIKVFDGEVMLPSQADEIALHLDGSVSYAVCSAYVPSVADGVPKTLSIKSVAKEAAPALPDLVLDPNWQFVAKATIYRRQVTRIRFTDRSTGGYVVGETVQLELSGIGPTETYTVTIKSSGAFGNQTGVSFSAGENIAKEFVSLAAGSANYDVYRLNNQGYERVWIKAKDPSAAAFTLTITYAGTSVITQINDSVYEGPPQEWTVDLHAAAAAKIASLNAGSPTTGVRLRGPAVTELEFDLPFMLGAVEHPHLRARPSVRLYNNGDRIRTDFVIENNWTFVENPAPVVYGLAIENDGVDVFTQPVFSHSYACRWHKITWFGENADVFLKHDVPYFIDTKAVHNYDRDLVISEAAIEDELADINTARSQQAAFGPLAWLLWEPLMGTTGGRRDLGPSPTWFVMHLLAQDPRTKEIMLAQADAAVGWDIHYRDETHGNQIFNIEDYPTFSSRLYTPGASPLPSWRGPNSIEVFYTGTSSDFEHQADFAYLPYLLTGELFYLDELLFWASYCLHGRTPGTRDNANGRVVGASTVRAQAWSLRTIGCAARITPQNHPLKAHFERVLDYNLDWMASYYQESNPLTSPLGALAHTTGTSSAPWQCDFMASTLSLLADNGYADALSALSFISNFTVGRFLTPDFCIRLAAGYYWNIKDGGGNFLTTWQQVYELEWPGYPIGQCSTLPFSESEMGYPGITTGYAAQALGALGAVHRSGIANGKVAYDAYKTQANVATAYASDPTWAIIPLPE